MISDDMLSQDEIDALLRGALDDDEMQVPYVDDVLSIAEQDALGEIGNISFGSSATALSMLLNQKVEITTPNVSVIHRQALADEFPLPYVAIQVNYTEGFLGTNLLVIQQSDAAIIADLMLGGDGKNPSDMLGEIQLSAVQEAMNQMMGSAATSMSTIFSKKVDISPPTLHLLDVKEGEGIDTLPEEDILVKVSFRLKIGDLIDSNIMQLLPLNFAKEMVQNLLNPSSANESLSDTIGREWGDPAQTAPPKAEISSPPPISHPTEELQFNQSQQAAELPTYAYSRAYQQGPQHFGMNAGINYQAKVQPVDFASFEPTPLAETEAKNLNMLLDIPLQVTVELGRTKRSVQDILNLSSGSIIELDKLAGEPVDILVNNKLIAKGEVVVIDENFGVRVTDIISQSDRLKKLK
ncbi:flagellar motor switch protein FliN/FliY [Anoxybacillus vitaminiphilus]|uniref:Flagellar motor switch protein FliN/FliY n=1 Tax=Paranoxybacillus vitaminiphilus TaxID=581036 RepID=A0A327YZK0_9BACL|nr:flagellar motor switch phosphatase FliY [Anoxybacillus vitaminiphilus]RAK23379.1 flagellar motor switch protein FliN/FliY [Anoxybacillus vitaminiphilus]